MPAPRVEPRHPARAWIALFFGTLLTACGGDDRSFFASPATVAPDTRAYVLRPLVSNGTLTAATTDPLLIDPWGIVFAPGTRVFVANNATDVITRYDGDGIAQPQSISLPGGINGPAAPTGIVFNDTTDFLVGNGATSAPATVIVAGEGGMLIALAPAVSQAPLVAYDDGSGRAAYTGLALAAHQGAQFLYATDFRNGKVDVFDASFRKITSAGGFADPSLPAGYAPFGIKAVALNDETVLFVTYAQRAPDSTMHVEGAGLGLVNIFDTGGTLLRHFVSAGVQLNAPWGVALAPGDFGALSNAVLIGNVGDGVINAFDPASGEIIDSIRDSAGNAIAIPGLRGIAFGNGSHAQPVTTLFFAASVANGAGGLYGRIDLAQSGGSSAFSSGGGRAPSDSTPPSVHITVPGPDATASNVINVGATANDNVGVARVEFFAGPFSIGSAVLPPFVIEWDTTTVANGTYVLVARATDFAGNFSTSIPIVVHVSNVPRAPPR
jgi:uncharacterized protein (TIGR03118 family)